MSNLKLWKTFMKNLVRDFIKWFNKLFDKDHRQFYWERFKLFCTIIVTTLLIFSTCVLGYMFGLACVVNCHRLNLIHHSENPENSDHYHSENHMGYYNEISECMSNQFDADPGRSIMLALFGVVCLILIIITFSIVFTIFMSGLMMVFQFLFKISIQIKDYLKTKWAQSVNQVNTNDDMCIELEHI